MVSGLQVDARPPEPGRRIRHARGLQTAGRAPADLGSTVDLDHRVGIRVHGDVVRALGRDGGATPTSPRRTARGPRCLRFRAGVRTPRRLRIGRRARNTPLPARLNGETGPRPGQSRRQRNQKGQSPHDPGQGNPACPAGHPDRGRRATEPAGSPGGHEEQGERGDAQSGIRQVPMERLRPPGNELRPDVHAEGREQQEDQEPGPELGAGPRRRTDPRSDGSHRVADHWCPHADDPPAERVAIAHATRDARECERDVGHVGTDGHVDEARIRHRARDVLDGVGVRRGGDGQVREVPERGVPRPRAVSVEREVVNDELPTRRRGRRGPGRGGRGGSPGRTSSPRTRGESGPPLRARGPVTASPGTQRIRSARPDSSTILRAHGDDRRMVDERGPTGPCRRAISIEKAPEPPRDRAGSVNSDEVVASREKVRGTGRARVLAPDELLGPRGVVEEAGVGHAGGALLITFGGRRDLGVAGWPRSDAGSSRPCNRGRGGRR